MELVNKEYVVKNRRNIIKYIKENKLYFSKNFFTDLYNVNSNQELTKRIVEGTIYKNNLKTIDEISLNLFNLTNHKDLNLFWNVLKEIQIYITTENKDWDKEYDIVQLYWKWVKYLNEKNIEDFNNYLLFFTRNLYKKTKGFKK